jgi:hypothetical protein
MTHPNPLLLFKNILGGGPGEADSLPRRLRKTEGRRTSA